MRKGILLMMAALLVFGACQSKKENPKDIADHVIIIGLDGWGTWSFKDGDTPFIKEKMKEGSWTLYKSLRSSRLSRRSIKRSLLSSI